MKEIVFLTGNNDKVRSAKEVFKDYRNILINNLKTDTIEIQSLDVKDVAEYTVKEASNRLDMNVFKMDSGYYFEALNGFPGSLVKYFDNSLSSEDILKLIEGKSRVVEIRECLAYCEPHGKPVSFEASVKATISDTPQGEGGSIDRIIVYEGFNTTQAASNYDDIVKYWNTHLDHYKQFADYLCKNL